MALISHCSSFLSKWKSHLDLKREPDFMFEKKKPTLVETPLPKTMVEAPLKSETTIDDVAAFAATVGKVSETNQEPTPTTRPGFEPVITLADLMMELSIVGEVFAKRKLFAVLSLRHQNGHFNLTASWKTAEGESRAFVGRKIGDTLTPKGLALVIGELKESCGI